MGKLKKYSKIICFVIICLVAYLLLPAKLFNDPTSCVILDRDGSLLGARISADGQWRFPETDSVPEKLSKALVLFEDRRFYNHKGVDGIAIARAFVKNIKQGKVKEGGSTISMQLIRLMRKDKKRTLWEKAIESVLAFRLELAYSKSEILALYASNAPFGSNVVGFSAAAWRYFGREADDLSWAEAATLAVLPNAPALIHPGRNRDALKVKRDMLLNMLCDKAYFPKADLSLYKEEIVPEKPMPLPRYAPHLLDNVALLYPDKETTTTISSGLQQSVVAVVEQNAKQFKANMVNNASVIVADVRTGEVLAYVGNISDINKSNGTDVDIIKAPRSSGSILKPFLYAAMLDDGSILPTTLVPDIPLHISGFSPSNYNRTFDGAVSASDALIRSLNVPSVKMLQDYNIEKFYHLLKDLGISTLDMPAMHYGLSLILGGSEATLWDISSAYASMARVLNNFSSNSGEYNIKDWRKLHYVKKENIAEFKKVQRPYLNAASIYQTFSALAELNRPEEESSWKIYSSGRRVAWKTGTSYGNRDAWAVGVTPDFVVGVWVGNASGEGRPLLTGVGYAAPLLFDVFSLLPGNSGWFQPPYDEMTKIEICKKGGHRATNLCETTDSVWIVNSGLDSYPCPYHIQVHLDETEQFRVNRDCYPADKIRSKGWFILPPAQAWFYRKKNIDYLSLPPLHPNCAGIDDINPIEIIYPKSNISVMVPKQMDGELAKVVFHAAHLNSKSIIYWHIDDVYIGQTDGEHKIGYTPSQGRHIISLVDDKGNMLKSYFEVK